MLASSLREEAQATVSNKPGHRGEREVSRKTIARGMPGDFRCDRGDYARVLFHFAREAAGASCARHSLRPLTSEGRTFSAKLARKARRDREAVSANVRCLKIETEVMRTHTASSLRKQGPITTVVRCSGSRRSSCQ